MNSDIHKPLHALHAATLLAIFMFAPFRIHSATSVARAVSNVSKPLTTSALLATWRASEKQRQSFILDFEMVTCRDEVHRDPKYPGRSGKSTRNSQGEMRSDGARMFLSRTERAHTTIPRYATLNEGERKKTSLWDGRVLYSYTPDNILVVTVGRGSSELNRLTPAYILTGHLYDMKDPLDKVVGRAGTSRLRPKPDLIDGFPCQVIEASGREGRFTLWFDTQRGNNLVKAEMHLVPGNVINGNPVLRGYQVDATLSKVQLQQTDGIWFPTGYTYECNELFPAGHIRSTMECRLSRVKMNPDFNALKAFVPTMVENGTRVRLTGPRSKEHFVWRNGKIIDKAGQSVRF